MAIGINEFNKSTCIIAHKVFAQCKAKECVNNTEIPFPSHELRNIKFLQGFIIDGTLKIYNIENRPDYKRIIFEVRIPFNVETYNGGIYSGFLPDIKKDVVLFIPDIKRSELKFNIDLQTNSKVLGDVIDYNNNSYFTSGISMIISVVAKVQLFIPYFGFCQDPSMCINFQFEDDICKEFYDKEFPDFYPPQLRCKKKWIRKDIKVRKVNDVIIYGQIKNCVSDEPIKGAIIKAFYTDAKGNLMDICHTFSGCSGYYMLRLPEGFKAETITIMASKNNCTDLPTPCEC